MKEILVRLRDLRGGPVDMFVRGRKFVAGKTELIPEVLELEDGGTFPLASFVLSLRDGERNLFEVVEDEAQPVAPEAETAGAEDDGAEFFTAGQREEEEAERAAVEEAQAETKEGAGEGASSAVPAVDAQPTGRRAQRMARRSRKAGKEPATG